MTYYGDFANGQIIDITFTSRDSTGTPSTLSGVKLALGMGASTSSFSQGLSLTTDFGGIVGRNHVTITSGTTMYLDGQDYHLFALAGQVSPTTIVGETIARFSINNRFGGAVAYGKLQTVASTSQVSLPSTASTTNDIYNGAMVLMQVGPGQAQARYISDYTGATFSAQLDQALGTAVTSSTTVVVYPGVPGSAVSADLRYINGTLLTGDGSTSSWGPA